MYVVTFYHLICYKTDASIDLFRAYNVFGFISIEAIILFR